MTCPDCNNTGFVTLLSSRKKCLRCEAAKADELIGKVMTRKAISLPREQYVNSVNSGVWMLRHIENIVTTPNGDGTFNVVVSYEVQPTLVSDADLQN